MNLKEKIRNLKKYSGCGLWCLTDYVFILVKASHGNGPWFWFTGWHSACCYYTRGSSCIV